MASIVVRGLDEAVKKRIAAQAKSKGCSMEAEVRHILTDAVRQPHIGMAFLEAAQGIEGIDLPIPQRRDEAQAAEFE